MFFARFSHVNIREVSIGLGPILFRKRSRSNNFFICIRAFPIMAYVMMDSHALRDLYTDQFTDPKYHFYMSPLPPGKKLLEDCNLFAKVRIITGGVFFNLILFSIMWPVCIALFNFNNYQFVNPFIQLKNVFVVLGHNFILQKTDNGGTIFGQIVRGAGSNLDVTGWALTFAQILLVFNLELFVINIIPLPPLDGFKFLEFIFEKKLSHNTQWRYYLSMFMIILLIYIVVSGFVVDLKYR